MLVASSSSSNRVSMPIRTDISIRMGMSMNMSFVFPFMSISTSNHMCNGFKLVEEFAFLSGFSAYAI